MKKTDKVAKRTKAYLAVGIDYDLDRLSNIDLEDEELDTIMVYGLTEKSSMEIVEALGLDPKLVSVDINTPFFEDDDDEILERMREGDYLLGFMVSYERSANHLVERLLKDDLPIYRVTLHYASVANLCHELAHIKHAAHSADFEDEEDDLLRRACDFVLNAQ